MNRLMPALLVLAVAGFLTACGDAPDPAGPDVNTDGPDMMVPATLARSASLLTELTASIFAAQTTAISTEGPVRKTASCPAVTFGFDQQDQTVSILIDAGEGCLWNGRTVRGTTTIAVALGQDDDSTKASASFTGFAIEEHFVTGRVATVFVFDPDAGLASGTVTTNLNIIDDLATTTLDADFEVVAGTRLTPELSDDTATMSGTARVSRTAAPSFFGDVMVSAVTPIAFDGSCAYPRSGIIEAAITSNNQVLPALTIDFQPVDGGCDSIALMAGGGNAAQMVDFMDLGN